MRLAAGVIVASLIYGGAQTTSPKPPVTQASAKQAGTADTKTGKEKITGIIVAQDKTSVTVLAKSPSGTPVTRTLHVDEDTTVRGAKADWRLASAPKSGQERVQYYDLRGKAGEFELMRGEMKVAIMQSACDPDLCALKACAKKCGATPCTCPTSK